MENAKIIDLVKKVSEERDEIAFSEIFDFIAPKINAYYLQNGLITENAEELTQEVMSTVWAKSSLYNSSKSSVSTWIFTIARNKKVDFLRKKTDLSVNEEDIREFLYHDNNTDKISESETRDQVKKLNQELDENQRRIIKMSFFENKSHKKIADELEIPLGTVKSRIRHILIKMQRLL